MSRIRVEQSGWTLIELLVAMTLMIVVLTATLTSFDTFGNTTTRNANANEQQETVRRAMDRMMRQLRNLASPSNGQATINYADSEKLIFQTTDPSKQWVAYCLQTSTQNGITASAQNSILWYQTFTNGGAPAAAPPNQNCPDSGNAWTQKTRIIDHVTNDNVSGRPMFTYQSYTSTSPLSVPVSNPSTIIRVAAQVYLDLDLTKSPAETNIASEAFLRNQNQPPAAAFNGLRSGTTYTLDAGVSVDPEGRTLKYDWYEGPVPNNFSTLDVTLLQDCSNNPVSPPVGPWNLTCIGSGPVLIHDFAGDSTATTVNNVTFVRVYLRVTDPGGLADITEIRSGDCPLNTDSTRSNRQCDSLPIS